MRRHLDPEGGGLNSGQPFDPGFRRSGTTFPKEGGGGWRGGWVAEYLSGRCRSVGGCRPGFPSL